MKTDNGRTDDGASVVVQHTGEVHLGTTIVQAVSEATGVAPRDMETELNDVIDPDALNHLFADRLDGSPRQGGRVEFRLQNCRVTVDGDGRITVTRSV